MKAKDVLGRKIDVGDICALIDTNTTTLNIGKVISIFYKDVRVSLYRYNTINSIKLDLKRGVIKTTKTSSNRLIILRKKEQ